LQNKITKGVVPFSDEVRILSEKTCSRHSQVTFLRAEVYGWLPIVAEVVPGYVVLWCPFDLLIRNVFKKHADQAAAVKAQADGVEIFLQPAHLKGKSVLHTGF